MRVGELDRADRSGCGMWQYAMVSSGLIPFRLARLMLLRIPAGGSGEISQGYPVHFVFWFPSSKVKSLFESCRGYTKMVLADMGDLEEILIIDRDHAENQALYSFGESEKINLTLCEKCGDALQKLQQKYFQIIILNVRGMPESEIAGLAALVREYASDPTVYLIAVSDQKVKKLSLGRLIQKGIDDIIEPSELPEGLWNRITVGLRITQSHKQYKISPNPFLLCGYTNKIKTESGNWVPLVKYLNQKFRMKFKYGKSPEFQPRSSGQDLNDE
ncbi:MAG: hypothetical protein AAGH72_01840 [Verrucomicrobiota bacterium]